MHFCSSYLSVPQHHVSVARIPISKQPTYQGQDGARSRSLDTRHPKPASCSYTPYLFKRTQELLLRSRESLLGDQGIFIYHNLNPAIPVQPYKLSLFSLNNPRPLCHLNSPKLSQTSPHPITATYVLPSVLTQCKGLTDLSTNDKKE